MGSSRTIDGEAYTLLTTASSLEEAEAARKHWLWLFETGYKVTYLEEDGVYLIYAKRPRYPTLDEILSHPGSLPAYNRPIYHPRKKRR